MNRVSRDSDSVANGSSNKDKNRGLGGVIEFFIILLLINDI